MVRDCNAAKPGYHTQLCACKQQSDNQTQCMNGLVVQKFILQGFMMWYVSDINNNS